MDHIESKTEPDTPKIMEIPFDKEKLYFRVTHGFDVTFRRGMTEVHQESLPVILEMEKFVRGMNAVTKRMGLSHIVFSVDERPVKDGPQESITGDWHGITGEWTVRCAIAEKLKHIRNSLVTSPMYIYGEEDHWKSDFQDVWTAMHRVLATVEKPYWITTGYDRIQLYHPDWKPLHTENMMISILRFEGPIRTKIKSNFGSPLNMLSFWRDHSLFSLQKPSLWHKLCRTRSPSLFNQKPPGCIREYMWKFGSVPRFENKGIEFAALPSQLDSNLPNYDFQWIKFVANFVITATSLARVIIPHYILKYEQDEVGADLEEEFRYFMKIDPYFEAARTRFGPAEPLRLEKEKGKTPKIDREKGKTREVTPNVDYEIMEVDEDEAMASGS